MKRRAYLTMTFFAASSPAGHFRPSQRLASGMVGPWYGLAGVRRYDEAFTAPASAGKGKPLPSALRYVFRLNAAICASSIARAAAARSASAAAARGS